MKVGYDPGTDTLRIAPGTAPIAESDEDKPGVIPDDDASGSIVGIEILQASRRIDHPGRIERLYANAERGRDVGVEQAQVLLRQQVEQLLLLLRGHDELDLVDQAAVARIVSRCAERVRLDYDFELRG